MTKKKILMVMRKYHGIGGHDTVINNLCIGLNEIGYDTYIGAFSFIQDPPKNLKKIKLNKLNLFSSHIDGVKFDVIHSHETSMNYYSIFNKSKFVFHYHGANGTLQKYNLKLSLLLCKNNISKIISVSKSASEHLKFISHRIPIDVIYNGVDTSFFNSDLSQDNRLGNPQLLFVGNLSSYKNVGKIIDAMSFIIKQFPSAHLQIVGTGDDYNHLKEKIISKQLENHVKLVGKLEQNELRFRYSSCDLYVSASSLEAHPVPIFEAMACGKPVVLSAIPAHKELISMSKAGRIFSTNNPFEICEKICEVYSLRHALAKTSKEFVQKYDWSLVCKKVSKIYDEFI